MKKRIRRNWDFLVSLLSALAAFLYLPTYVRLSFAKELYSNGIAVMAIVFSIVFAAIAVIASGGETRFIAFLEEGEGGFRFTDLLNSFDRTLGTLLASLLISLGEYGYAAFRVTSGVKDQSKMFLVVFMFFLLYALIASRLIAGDAIKFAKTRAKFAVAEEESSLGLRNPVER